MIQRLVGGFALTAGIGSVLGFFGAWYWAFDLLANFRFQYLVVSIATAGALGYLRNRSLLLMAVAVALLNAAIIAPLYLGSAEPAAEGETLSIVAFNIQLSNPSDQLDWILATDPDIVLLFESSRPAEDALRNADLPYNVVSGIDEDRFFGPTVLVGPGVQAERLETSRQSGGAMRLEMAVNEQQIAVYALHPPSPSTAERAVARNEFLRRFGTMVAEETIPVIVAGDLNATPWSAGFRLLAQPAELVNSQKGYGVAPTWPAGVWSIAAIPLDHVLHTDHLTTVDRRVGPALRSDHKPVYAEIGFRR